MTKIELSDHDLSVKSNKKEDLIISARENGKINMPWIEKYRPKTIDELVIDINTLSKIKKIIKEKDMPNIIISGSPGIGKTTTILCITRELLGNDYKEGVLELNASDDRGIKSVQEFVVNFCKKRFLSGKNKKQKIIIFDEVDNMTTKAQQLLNKLMEQYNNTRFAFTCNDSSKIIESIQSRCVIFRYSRLESKQINNRLKEICKRENIKFTEDGISSIVLTSQGDLRQAINILDITARGYNKITTKNVYNLSDKPHPLVIQKILSYCLENNIVSVFSLLEKLRKDGYSSYDITFSMLHVLELGNIKNMSEELKIKFITIIGNTCKIISKGVDTPLQLTGCVSNLILLSKKN